VVKYGYKLQEVGKHLGLHYSTVNRIVRRRKSKVKICPLKTCWALWSSEYGSSAGYFVGNDHRYYSHFLILRHSFGITDRVPR
jgi:hypothetical protein